MDAHIKFEGNITDEISYDLEQLAYLIEQDCDLSVGREKQPPKPGVKESGLIIGLTIAGVVLSGIQALFSALSYWGSKQQKYSLLICFDNKTFLLENLDRSETNQVLAEIARLPILVNEKIKIKIVKK